MDTHGNTSTITQELVEGRIAARMLSLSLGTLDKLIDSGELRARRIGRRVLIHREEVARFATHDTRVGKGDNSACLRD